VIDGKTPYDSSVDQEIFRVLVPIFQPDKCVFSAGGREDIDVRMLGNGRPFVMELQNPKKYFEFRNIQMKDLENQINSDSKYVSVNSLEITDISFYEKIQQYQ
jgi:tRNA pseudouridine synthase 10